MKPEIEKFIELSEVNASTKYESPSSVKVGNKAAEELRLMSSELVYSGREEELLGLLDHKTAGPWVAFTVWEFSIVKQNQVRCVRLIHEIATGDNVESLGAKMWLKERNLESVNKRLNLTNFISGLKRMASKKIAK
jgi:hypothetical protein